MSKKVTSSDGSSSDINDDRSTSTESSKKKTSRKTKKTDSIRSYVTNLLTKETENVDHPVDLTQTQMTIRTSSNEFPPYENVSAFRPYQSTTDSRYFNDHQRQNLNFSSSTSEDDNADTTLIDQGEEIRDSISELNLDPNPLREVRESHEQVYKQKVYVRQLQPPTPQPVEIQVQEILVQPQIQKPPIHVRVGQREPRTPSPIIIKTAPPPPPPSSAETNQPIVYNKYLPPPKQPPQQIIIHRYPDLPPKPRPIVVEQWLPYKPAPKRIIKHSLPPEAHQAPPAPHNIIISYSKPRALIEVELVRLPIVKIDPQTYEQMSAAGNEQLIQHPTFQHEQDYLSGKKSSQSNNQSSLLDWRI